jgi:hypothetical protein
MPTSFPLGAPASERAKWKTEIKKGRSPARRSVVSSGDRGYFRIIPPGFRFALAHGFMMSPHFDYAAEHDVFCSSTRYSSE